MNRACVLIVLALLACLQAAGQDYVLVREVTLAGSAEAITVQRPATVAPGAVTFTGKGLNDMTAGGVYVGTAARTYCVKIDAAGTPDTFSWGTNAACNDGATGVSIGAGALSLNYGITVTFGATTGHTLADTWSFPVPAPVRVVRFVGAYIYCSVDCAVTLERNGTAAAATAATPTPLLPVTAAATATAYVASDVGVGTVLGKYTIPAGGSLPLNLSRLALFGDGTGKNITLRFGAMTGTVKAVVLWTEER